MFNGTFGKIKASKTHGVIKQNNTGHGKEQWLIHGMHFSQHTKKHGILYNKDYTLMYCGNKESEFGTAIFIYDSTKTNGYHNWLPSVTDYVVPDSKDTKKKRNILQTTYKWVW